MLSQAALSTPPQRAMLRQRTAEAPRGNAPRRPACGTTLAHAIHSAAKGQPVVVVAALCNKCSALVVKKGILGG